VTLHVIQTAKPKPPVPVLRPGARIRLTQLDGALPNLALMKLGAWHRAQGHEVVYTRVIEDKGKVYGIDENRLFEGEYDLVYGSAIFSFSEARVRRFERAWPGAILGGTGARSEWTVEAITGDDFNAIDYSGWPEFDASIGFTQRGCRLKCKFCVVPLKEGKNRSVATIADIWRGEGHAKKLHLLDNDFFGQEHWRERIDEIRNSGFRVCFSQGINVRKVDDEVAAALATIEYRNTKFDERQLYTAWDNLKDEEVFFDGVNRLERAGIPPKHLMAYMLVGFDRAETWARVWHRFNLMVERGIKPFVMVYDRTRADLISFARWCNTGLYRIVPWDQYVRSTRSVDSTKAYLEAKAA
jgi:hypothetical protein